MQFLSVSGIYKLKFQLTYKLISKLKIILYHIFPLKESFTLVMLIFFRCLKVIELLQSCCEKCSYKSTHCASVAGLLKNSVTQKTYIWIILLCDHNKIRPQVSLMKSIIELYNVVLWHQIWCAVLIIFIGQTS